MSRRLHHNTRQSGGGGFPLRWHLLLLLLLVALSWYDLTSGHFSAPTILRQTQTAMLTENFTREGFSLHGLYLTIHGNGRPVMAYEFPIYNFLVGLCFRAFGFDPLWGKVVSLLAAAVTVVTLCHLAKRHFSERIALYTALFFLLSPLGVMMRTAFQPDSFALMCVLLALVALARWYREHSLRMLLLFSLLLLLGGWAKYPVMVPYIPVILLGFFAAGKRTLRIPTLAETAVVAVTFVLPFVAWYCYRGTITHPQFGTPLGERSMFLLGDLHRFLVADFYVRPFYTLAVFACSGAGFLFFLLGLTPFSPLRLGLLLGIPVYYVVVPTVSDQHYYFFACLPIVALFMATGFDRFRDFCRSHRMTWMAYAACTLFVLSSAALSYYVMVLRQDKVMAQAGESVRRLTRPDDLIFVMNMHNRSNGFGGNNPTLFYLSGRKGWNISTSFDLWSALKQIEQRRKEGARWLVVTWYSPALEPWVEQYLPASAHTGINPGIDGKSYLRELGDRYPVIFKGDHYAILKL